MNVRRRSSSSFRPTVDCLPSRIAPTVYAPIPLLTASSGGPVTVSGPTTPSTQTMPTDPGDVVGPGSPS